MGKIAHIRIDGRLIHGQVCTQWVHKKGAKRIIIVDDVIAKDAFLSQICVMATPVGTVLEVISCEDAAKRWQENELGPEGPIFVLFQTCDMALKAYQTGFTYPYLNFGTTINKGNMVKTGVGAISINPEHAQALEDCAKQGLEIYFQVIPDEPRKEWKDIRAKLFPEVK